MVVGLSYSLCGDLEKNPNNIFDFFFFKIGIFFQNLEKSHLHVISIGTGAEFWPWKTQKKIPADSLHVASLANVLSTE